MILPAEMLLTMLEGLEFANALRRNGKPCRIRLPEDYEARAALVRAHLDGTPMTLIFQADSLEPWHELVDAVVLAAFCPAADGQCRWIAIDLDGKDHGARGLADPVHAMRCIAERAGVAGLANGLLAVRSRRGQGRHVFLLLPEPTMLADAVIGVAALTATAFKVAASDVADGSVSHAFRRANGSVAKPGDAGAVELIPRSTAKPPYGWPLALPCAGAFRASGGGIIVDAFTDVRRQLDAVPRCDPSAWATFIDEARSHYDRAKPVPNPVRSHLASTSPRFGSPMDRVDRRTRDFLDGRVPRGSRNAAAFAASANLLGCGVAEAEAERLILAGAAACGLSPREATAAFASAKRATSRAGRRL